MFVSAILRRFGSITQASTVLLGSDANGQDVFIPMNQIVPMVNPDDIGMYTIFINIETFLSSCFFTKLSKIKLLSMNL